MKTVFIIISMVISIFNLNASESLCPLAFANVDPTSTETRSPTSTPLQAFIGLLNAAIEQGILSHGELNQWVTQLNPLQAGDILPPLLVSGNNPKNVLKKITFQPAFDQFLTALSPASEHTLSQIKNWAEEKDQSLKTYKEAYQRTKELSVPIEWDEKMTLARLGLQKGNDAPWKALLTRPDFNPFQFRITENLVDIKAYHPRSHNNRKTFSLLSWLMLFGHTEQAVELITKFGEVHQYPDLLLPPLFNAVWTGDLNMINLLMEKGAHADQRGIDGRNALHMALRRPRGQLTLVNALVKGQQPSQIDFNSQCDFGYTPLMYAMFSRNTDAVRFLVEKQGVDLAIHSKDGNTALHWAVEMNHYQYMKILVDNGANIHQKRNNHGTLTPMQLTRPPNTNVKEHMHWFMFFGGTVFRSRFDLP